MNDATMFGGDDGRFEFGTLLPLWTFKPRPENTCGLPNSTPVLTCAVTEKEAENLLTDCSDSYITFEYVGTHDFFTLNFCLHLGSTRVYWVVEISDPEVYEAIEMWKGVGQIPIVFFARDGEARRQLYHSVRMPPFNPRVEPFWSQSGDGPSARKWEAMNSLLDAWRRLPYITKVIVGTPLRHALGNVLLTKRWERLINEGVDITNSSVWVSAEGPD